MESVEIKSITSAASSGLKIALGDLRHIVAGRHSTLMPIGINYIASFTLANLDSDDLEIRFYVDADTLLKDICVWEPNVIGLSNYIWNAELSGAVFRYAKKMNPDTVCISGGPEFPIEQKECEEYLLKKKEIDFFAYREGEIAFTQLIGKLQKRNKPIDLKCEPNDGMMSISPKTGRLIVGKSIPRIMNLDVIPSPYLNGSMDQWFDGRYIPVLQTARGCPFTCGYCRCGDSWYSPIAKFSIERIKRELDYIFEKIHACPDSATVLYIHDADFGMTARDEKIAEYIGYLLKKFNWPDTFNITTGRANYDRIIRVASLLQNKTYITVSVQSLNEKTMEAIKRENLSLDSYREIFRELKKQGMPSFSELIIPMPEETKDSFLEAVRALFNVGVQDILIHTMILLKGTLLATQAYQWRYGMKKKFRLAARQFGQYEAEKCFEIEEVCVATNSMSFEDYLECRGFSLLLLTLAGTQYDVIGRHLNELDIDSFDYFIGIWESIKSGKTELSQIYFDFINETKNELWDSPELLYDYFSKQENYKKLLSSELGDNLLRKYRTKMLLEKGTSVIQLLYAMIKKMLGRKLTEEINDSLNAAEKWAIATRNVAAAVEEELFRREIIKLRLPFDVNNWYSSFDGKPLTSFRKSVTYGISYDFELIEKALTSMRKIFGERLTFALGKYFMDNTERNFWGKSELLG